MKPIPRWPGPVARTASRTALGMPGGLEAVAHVGTVWSAVLVAVGRHDSLEFGARVAQHVERCPECELLPVLAVWSAVARYAGLVDIIRVFNREKRSR